MSEFSAVMVNVIQRSHTHVSFWLRYLKASLIHSCVSLGLSSTLVSRLLMSSVSLSKYLLSSCVTQTSADDQRSWTRPSVTQKEMLTWLISALIYSIISVRYKAVKNKLEFSFSDILTLTLTDRNSEVHGVELFILLGRCLPPLSFRSPPPLGFMGGEGRNWPRGAAVSGRAN